MAVVKQEKIEARETNYEPISITQVNKNENLKTVTKNRGGRESLSSNIQSVQHIIEI